jgi:predicted phosphodiesterase
MLRAIHLLIEKGAREIVHLGDFCDSLLPETMDHSVEILKKYNVKAILGNNEYAIKTEYIPNNPGILKECTVSFLNQLPYNLTIDDLCFTHSLPYNWPAATRQPLEGLVKFPLVGDMIPFRIMFRGHSHSMSVVEYYDEERFNIFIETGKSIKLKDNRKYIITVGAAEDYFCALYDPEADEFSSIYI